MHTSLFDYELPSALIAQQPLAVRDACRLLRLTRDTGSCDHLRFSALPSILRAGDLLVLNDTRVLPARLIGHKESGGKVEILLTRRLADASWLALTRPGLPLGRTVAFEAGLSATVTQLATDGQRVLEFNRGGTTLDQLTHRLGVMPVPPYVRSQLADPNDYQTVYARDEGSVAAPTAGLHFTTALIDDIAAAGINVAYLTLHVGIGTFRPVKVEDVSSHPMPAEAYQLGPAACAAIKLARTEGRRVVAVGTTVVRVLETIADRRGHVTPSSGETSLFILPGYTFRVVDALITNFHLPRSTLLMLVAAFAGRDRIFAAYHEAIEKRYRFYSFGDAMLIE